MKRNFPAAPDAALLVIDLQKAIDHPSWGERNNPQAEQNIAALLHVWRATRRPIYHIGHDSMEPGSPYRPGQPGNEFKPEAQPLAGEVVIRKRTNTGAVSVAVRIKKVGLSAEAGRRRCSCGLRGKEAESGNPRHQAHPSSRSPGAQPRDDFRLEFRIVPLGKAAALADPHAGFTRGGPAGFHFAHVERIADHVAAGD